jgi:type IV pilus assembly protein PilY1
VAYYTTYAPGQLSTDPCIPGNLGLSRLYAVDYLTGEAVLNYNNLDNNGVANNDSESTAGNERGEDAFGNVLRRADRSVELGIGIPSGIVVLLSPVGDPKLLIGCGGGLCSEDPAPGGAVYPIYWRPY